MLRTSLTKVGVKVPSTNAVATVLASVSDVSQLAAAAQAYTSLTELGVPDVGADVVRTVLQTVEDAGGAIELADAASA